MPVDCRWRPGPTNGARRGPNPIELGVEAKLTAEFDINGGNAPYAGQFISPVTTGLTLETRDSGQGTFTVKADEDVPKAGEYVLLITDEEQRPIIVKVNVAAAP